MLTCSIKKKKKNDDNGQAVKSEMLQMNGCHAFTAAFICIATEFKTVNPI